ncbi:MAG: transporter substrate-binding domain-containing protein [Chthoniobacterales bacterium]|nr:transporter substrate-binding domain-containing protein [Chthoniobacterales bacterium]
MKKILVTLSLLAVCTAAGVSQAPQQKLRVFVKPAEPFAFEQDGVLKGYSIDVWNKVAEEAGLQFETTVVRTVPELLDAVKGGQADVGVGALSITPEREKLMDFSHPFFNSGLQILARAQGQAGAFSAFRALFNKNVAQVVIVLLLAVLVVSHLLWMVERRINAESFPEGYIRGVWESAWWSIATLISGGCENKAPVGVAGRLVAVVWMLGGIGLTSYITATLASAMTVNTLTSEISGLGDLRGSRVATVSGAAAETLLNRAGFDVAGFPDLAGAVDALKRGQVKGVVYDSPMLRYYVARHPGEGLAVVGAIFDPQDYGFAMPLGSPVRKPINAALLNIKTAGVMDELDGKWFAPEE